MLELTLLVAFVFVVLLVYGIYILLFGNKVSIKERMESLEQNENSFDESYSKDALTVREQLGMYSENFSKYLPSKQYLEKRKKRLNQTSVPMKAEEFLAISILSGVLLGGLLYLITLEPLLVILGFVVGFKVPDVILGIVSKKRRIKLSSQLPEALVIIANGLRAGYGFTQAMGVAAKELEDPISSDFGKIVRDNSLGKPIDEVMEGYSKKAQDEDVDMFVTALIIQRQVGGNLAEILDSLAATIRAREELRGEIKTLTTEGKFSGVIISLLPVAIALVVSIINPEYIGLLFNSLIGNIMLGVGIFMQLTGIFALTKIVNIEI